MSSLAAAAASSSYHYEPYPSFFTILEIPIRKLHDARNCRGEISGPNLAMRIVVYPVVLCLAPLSMLVDIISGVAETAFACYKGCDTTTLKSILLKKMVASPIQHLTFITINGGGCLISAGYLFLVYQVPLIAALPFSGFLTIFTYPLTQQAIGLLPKWARPDGFTIFIDGGAEDLDGSKYTQQFDEEYQKYKRGRAQEPWTYRSTTRNDRNDERVIDDVTL